MSIETLFKFPDPQIIEDASFHVNYDSLPPGSVPMVKSWRKDTALWRYDFLDGKLPVIISVNDKGRNQSIPQVLGIRVYDQKTEIVAASDLYEGHTQQEGFGIQHINNNGIIGIRGAMYNYCFTLSETGTIESVHLTVENRCVFGDTTKKDTHVHGTTNLDFYKSGEFISKELWFQFNPGEAHRFRDYGYAFDTTGRLARIKISPDEHPHKKADLMEIVRVLDKKKFRENTLQELQIKGRRYLDAMSRYQENFGRKMSLDYEQVLKNCVE